MAGGVGRQRWRFAGDESSDQIYGLYKLVVEFSDLESDATRVWGSICVARVVVVLAAGGQVEWRARSRCGGDDQARGVELWLLEALRISLGIG